MRLFTSNARQKRSRFVLPFLAGVLVFTGPVSSGFLPVPYAVAATQKTAVTYKLSKQSESIVTSGVRQLTYAWIPSDSSIPTEVLHVLQVDLQNPYVQLNAMGGPKGSVTAKQSVGAMTRETGAVAGINGDVFRTASGTEGVPMGAQITSGQLLASTEQLQGMYAFGVTQDRRPVIDNFVFSGTVTATDKGVSYPLAGLNKSAYRTEPDKAYSHVNALYMYTNAWTAAERPANSSATPNEALIVDGIVTEVVEGAAISTPIPENGFILRGHNRRESGNFVASLAVGDRVAADYSLTTASGKTYNPSDFQMMVSGHTLLMDQGAPVSFTRDVNGLSGYADRARTAVGFSKDGSTAYMLTVEENGGRKGVTLKELQQMLKELGVWKAVNLDGGGSTTMVTRPLGDFQTQLTHPTSYGTTQRLVTNGIGVYTTAPQGSLKGIAASGPQTVFIGQQAAYSLKAYDTHYNPLDPNGLTATWSIDKQLGSFSNGTFQAAKAGTATVSVKSGSASDSLKLEIVGEAQIAKLIVEPSSTLLKPGSVINVPVKAQLTDGRLMSVPASSVSWEFRGFTATVQDGKLTVNKVQNDAAAGYAIARYDGYGAVAVLASGSEQVLEDFEKAAYGVSFAGTPVETMGSAAIVTGIAGRELSKVLAMDYDFTVGAGKRYANAVLNDGKGIAIKGSPSAMSLDVMGDGGMHWLRAEFINGDGKPAYATIADKVDWTGWKNIRFDLAQAGLKGEAKLTKLYLVNQENDQDERSMLGQIAFDNLVLQYPPGKIAVTNPTIEMKVGNKQATVDGAKVTLPGAPFIQKGTNTNYLPLRFVGDTLGAQVVWDNKTKRVTVLRGDKMLELWVGKDTMTANGIRQPVPAAPQLIKGSVYVPVRLISEQLGQKVDWENKTQTITIR
ncbi:phosphodiester glycosidase family protein [Cohnella sp. LGH]|uniref:phosphodiester glycosidase family protein n=1 Tax=Cohnella sp. LGH TaxID=1619153 RepID=UPI001ADBEDAA|nr:phosphodiester glycosidase family protein [Cohnella sp. LGH]QTH42306.1 phosphodiester glycosidase family protein [Cohnella sp. LGH]